MTTAQETTDERPCAEMLEGATVAEEIKREVAQEVATLEREMGVRPCLAVVRVGDDPASAIYVRNKVRTSEELGFRSEHHALDDATSTDQLLRPMMQARAPLTGIELRSKSSMIPAGVQGASAYCPSARRPTLMG